MAVAIITGAGRGIGRAMAGGLAHAGHDVVLVGRTRSTLDEVSTALGSAGVQVRVVPGDVVDIGTARAALDAAAEIGRLALLVNNAGVGGPSAPMWEQDFEEWWQVVTVNVRGAAAFAHEALPALLEAGGRIVNVNSLGGARPLPGSSAYSVSKSALFRLTDCLAAELVSTRVRVFDLSPGVVRTDMTAGSDLFRDMPDEAWTPIERSVEKLLALASGDYDDLNGRFVHAEDDLDELLSLARSDDGARRLRLTALED